MFNAFPYLNLLKEYDHDTFMCDTYYFRELGKQITGKITEVKFVTHEIDPTVSSNTILVLGKVEDVWYPVCSYWEDEITLTESELLGKTPKEVENYFWKLEKDVKY